jgi:hypothetical protein
MAQKRNLTIQLEAETIRKARMLAVERSTSVSRLVAEEIERLVGEDEQYRAAQQVALTQLNRGFHLGGEVPPPREELHDRGR